MYVYDLIRYYSLHSLSNGLLSQRSLLGPFSCQIQQNLNTLHLLNPFKYDLGYSSSGYIPRKPFIHCPIISENFSNRIHQTRSLRSFTTSRSNSHLYIFKSNLVLYNSIFDHFPTSLNFSN